MEKIVNVEKLKSLIYDEIVKKLDETKEYKDADIIADTLFITNKVVEMISSEAFEDYKDPYED